MPHNLPLALLPLISTSSRSSPPDLGSFLINWWHSFSSVLPTAQARTGGIPSPASPLQHRHACASSSSQAGLSYQHQLCISCTALESRGSTASQNSSTGVDAGNGIQFLQRTITLDFLKFLLLQVELLQFSGNKQDQILAGVCIKAASGSAIGEQTRDCSTAVGSSHTTGPFHAGHGTDTAGMRAGWAHRKRQFEEIWNNY